MKKTRCEMGKKGKVEVGWDEMAVWFLGARKVGSSTYLSQQGGSSMAESDSADKIVQDLDILLKDLVKENRRRSGGKIDEGGPCQGA